MTHGIETLSCDKTRPNPEKTSTLEISVLDFRYVASFRKQSDSNAT